MTRSLDLFPFPMQAATFSPCRTWRYRLWRMWDAPARRLLTVCGLNPSTADENVDDPTIRRCIGFAKAWGFQGLLMVNVFAYRSTSPTRLLDVEDPVGPENDTCLAEVAAMADRFVFAWGRHEPLADLLPPRVETVLSLVRGYGRRAAEFGTFGRNADGSPKHPLYLPASTAFVREELPA